MRQDRTKKDFNLLNLIRIIGQPFYACLVLLLSLVLIIETLFTTLLNRSLKLTKTMRSTLKQKFITPKIPFAPVIKKISHALSPLIPPITVPNLPTLKINLKPIFQKGLKGKKTIKQKRRIPLSHFPKPSFHLRRSFIFTTFIALTSVGIAFSFYTLVLKDLPKPQDLLNREQAVSTKIYDRHGRLLYKVYKNENRSIIRLSDVPPHVIAATLAIEDSNFYNHVGFSVKGILRAFKNNVKGNQLQGGSTITQQLVKNALLSSERTFTRKLKEVIVAIAVENYFTKDEILTMYFNEVGYGGPAYGIEEAAQMYLGKTIRDLNLAEAAMLAGLPAAPTVYSPFGANPEFATLRQHQVLNRMAEEGHITAEMAEKAKATPISFAPPRTDILAPHFVMYVKDLLVKKYGEQRVNQGGLEVVTTLDLSIQELAEQAVQGELERLKSLNVTNAAVVVTEPKTGQILAMVGSKNYFDTKNDGQVNVVLRPRQPGSSIKPVNYALALENGYTAATIIEDSPIVYKLPGSPPYAPQNYDGRFHGKVTLRQALANSYNIPAVKTLSQFGVSKMVALAKNMGISTWTNPSRFGLSLTLGGGEVRMLDMAVAYGTFANYGVRVDINPIQKITDFSGQLFEEDSCQNGIENIPPVQAAETSKGIDPCNGTRVLSPETSFILSDILSDNQARSSAFGTHSVLNIPNHQVAVKTGTTNDLRDNWTIGYTSDFLVAVWVGNNDNSPMSRVASGITGASPIWSQIITALLKERAPQKFIEPPGVIKVNICVPTQTLTCGGCPQTRSEFFRLGTEPKTSCHLETKPEDQPHPEQIDQILQGIFDRL